MSTADVADYPDPARLAFIKSVIKACADEPGVRSSLRQALRKTYDDIPQAARKHVIRAGAPADPADVRKDGVRAYYTVAALIAMIPARVKVEQPRIPASGHRTNLGGSLAEAVLANATSYRSAEAALAVLSKQSTNGLHLRLPGVISGIADRPDAVDWVQLLEDLESWAARRSMTARHWQQSFFHTVNRADRDARDAAAKAASAPAADEADGTGA